MTSRQSYFAWGLAILALGGLCFAAAHEPTDSAEGEEPIVVAQADAVRAADDEDKDSVAPETLLPANSQLYISFDGTAAHEKAWKETAAYAALYETGLMEAIEKVMTAFTEGQQLGEAERAMQQMFEDLTTRIETEGLSLAVSVTLEQGPPIPLAVLVLHDAGNMEAQLTAFVKKMAAEQAGLELNTREENGRTVTGTLIPLGNGPEIEVAWWSEGSHLVIAAGFDPVNGALAIADGEKPNITTNPLWKKYVEADTEFEVSSVTWVDFGSISKMVGGFPIPQPPQPPAPESTDPATPEDAAPDNAAGPEDAGDAPPPQKTVNDVLVALGLENMGALVGRTGFKGKATWATTTLEAPAPRKGILSLMDQEPITLDDLPPLPFGTNGFAACSVDWSKSYTTVLDVIGNMTQFAPPNEAEQARQMIAAIPDIIGFDPKSDLFESLGNVVCLYGDTRQGLFGIGVGLAIEVDDRDILIETLELQLGQVAEQSDPDTVSIHTTEKHGRKIYTVEIAGGLFNPAFVVDKEWMVIGLMPQTCEAFLLRVDGELTTWTPTTSYRDALDELPKEFTSITASDPRKMYRTLVGLAPILVPLIKVGIKESGIPQLQNLDLDLHLADLPPAEVVGKKLFPNVAVTTVDEKGVHSTSRTSLPAIPFLGSTDGATGVATVAIGTALVLPAIQQARVAARRQSSSNNLKQIGLAMHNYHDVNRRFPQGTIPNESLKTEERLSWMVELLPFVDQITLYDQIDRDQAWDSEDNKQWTATHVPAYENPQVNAPKSKVGATHYIGMAGLGEDAPTLPRGHINAGVFGYDRACRIQDMTDGTSNTIMIMESGKDFGPWSQGGKSNIRGLSKKPYINGPDGIGGVFPGGANALLGDGSVRFVSEAIDPTVMENLVRIRDGNPIPDF